MLSYLADENLHRDIVNLVRRHVEGPRIVRVQELGLRGNDDPAILEFAARKALVVVTRDRATFPGYAYQRVAEGKPMPGVVAIRNDPRLAKIWKTWF